MFCWVFLVFSIYQNVWVSALPYKNLEKYWRKERCGGRILLDAVLSTLGPVYLVHVLLLYHVLCSTNSTLRIKQPLAVLKSNVVIIKFLTNFCKKKHFFVRNETNFNFQPNFPAHPSKFFSFLYTFFSFILSFPLYFSSLYTFLSFILSFPLYFPSLYTFLSFILSFPLYFPFLYTFLTCILSFPLYFPFLYTFLSVTNCFYFSP